MVSPAKLLLLNSKEGTGGLLRPRLQPIWVGGELETLPRGEAVRRFAPKRCETSLRIARIFDLSSIVSEGRNLLQPVFGIVVNGTQDPFGTEMSAMRRSYL